jgi:Winged helix DNA-binding domain
MTHDELLRQRLYNQRLTGIPVKKPEDVVKWLGAVQSQEYPSAKWAIAERTSGVTDATMDAVFAAGKILRTHVMRPTWHFVLPEDIRWMLELTAPRVNTVCRSYYRKMKLDDAVFVKSHGVMARALRGGKTLTRPELADALREAGVTSPRDDRMRLTFIVMRAELDAVICSGPRIEKQFTYALVDERAPRTTRLDREAARAELARRYFTSHGPATLRDFMWWSGLTAVDARAGLDAVRPALVTTEIDGKTYWRPKREPGTAARKERAFLLTTYDECFVAYRDRASADATRAQQTERDRGQTVVIDGRVAGTWRRTLVRDKVVLAAIAFSSFSRSDKDAVAAAGERYARFLGIPVTVSFVR